MHATWLLSDPFDLSLNRAGGIINHHGVALGLGMNETLRLPPPDLLMQISNDSSQENFRASLPELRQVVGDYLDLSGRALRDMRRILDFGCGPGRLLFALQPLLTADQELHGCDVNEACARWAQDNLDFATVIQSDIEPPLPYPNDHFDFIYAASVFTHLTIELQFKWAWELRRILKPGGVALLTTSAALFFIRGFAALDYFPKREMNVFNADDVFAILATDNSVEIEGQREVATIHSLGAAQSLFSCFDMVKQIPVSLLAGGQTVNLLKKRPGDLIPISVAPVRSTFRTAAGLSDPIPFVLPSSGGVLKFALEFDSENFIGRFLKFTMDGMDAAFPFNACHGKGHLIEFAIPFRLGGAREVRLAAEHRNLLPHDVGFALRFVHVEA